MSTEAPLAVLIVGATGVFGSRLSGLVADDTGVRLTLGGRRRGPLEALAAELGRCAVQTVDRDHVTASEIERFDLVVDCAGPYQGSATRLIDQCIAARVNYVDLADGRGWICSIDRFDSAAKQAGVAVVTGASSIPALSHAVLDQLTSGWIRIDTIRIGIFPGNRAPRGRSVVEAILSYVGKPVRVFIGGGWRDVPGWALQGRVDCEAAGKRWASVCDTPEQELLVRRYRPTTSAEFVAGLELPLLHLGLWLLSWPVRWRLIKTLRPAAGVLLWIAQRLRPFGSDRGAMIVEAMGADSVGKPARSAWHLDATGNRGPYVPVLAALAMIRRMRDGWRPEQGAYPCSGLIPLEEFEPLLATMGIEHGTSPREPSPQALRAAA